MTTADGRGVVYRQRDRAKMFELLRASLRRQVRLARKFNRMRKVYREALPVLTSKQKWETVLLPTRSIAIGRCLSRRTPRGARTRRWSPCSRRSPTGRGCWRVPAALSHFGEHSAGLARRRRCSVRCCSRAAGGSGWPPGSGAFAGARGAVRDQAGGQRRTRPHHPAIAVNVGTPSRLSFPSAHATSTTAAAILLGRVTGLPLPWLLVPPMALSRLVLGVHYPSDVLDRRRWSARSSPRRGDDRRPDRRRRDE